jgi:large subunit ribosomal protein L18
MRKDEMRVVRHKRVRSKVQGTSECPRLSVFRSNKHIYAQVIDDSRGTTIVSASTMDKARKAAEVKTTTVETAFSVGENLAAKAREKGVTAVRFDRGGYKFHGQVKALADGARKGGLTF